MLKSSQLQRQVFGQGDFDAIADELSPSRGMFSTNPHRSMWGTGNFDANVVMVALDRQGYEVLWVDKRKGVEAVDLDSLFGLIVNVESFAGVLGMFKGRHWFGIRNASGVFWNHDSKLEKPSKLGGAIHVKSNLLQAYFGEPETQILLVRPLKKENEADGTHGGQDLVSEAMRKLEIDPEAEY